MSIVGVATVCLTRGDDTPDVAIAAISTRLSCLTWIASSIARCVPEALRPPPKNSGTRSIQIW